MRASSGTSSPSILPSPTTSTNLPKAPVPSEDQTQSFADVLKQQDLTSAPAKKTVASPAIPAPIASTAPTAPAAIQAPILATTTTKSPRTATSPAEENAPTEADAPATPAVIADTNAARVAPTPVGAGSTLQAILSAAATRGRAGSAAVNVTRTNVTTTPSASTATSTSGASSIPAGSDLATMMIQSMSLASHLSSAPAAKTAPTATASVPATSDAATPGSTSRTAADVAALNAQAPTSPASLAATTIITTTKAAFTVAAAMASPILAKSGGPAGREIPLSTSTKVPTLATTKEKKSASASSEGSFLQSSGTASKSPATVPSLIATPVMGVNDGSGNQQVATQSFSEKNVSGGVGASGASSVGTAPVEKKAPMSTDLNIPEAMTGTSVNTPSRAPAEVNILLSSNHDFEDALKQVVHIASLSEAAAARTPTRIAIELQTPPGAIVNVYVSKQDDQYRAQLSTSDPAALSWVQDKISALRQSNDLGVEVKWLPAQIESNPLSATATSSSGSNPNWNRDGQNQNNQQPDDRSQSQRQNPSSSYEDLAEAEAETFASNLSSVGGAA